MTLRRILELAVLPALVLAAFVVPVLVWGDRLPDEIAVHWGVDGLPDRGDDVRTTLSIFLTIWVTFWAGLLILLLHQKVGGTEARWLSGLVHWAGGLLVLVWVLGLRANLDVVDWRDADPLPAWQLFAAMLAALPLGAVAWLLAGGRPAEQRGRGSSVAPLVAEDGQSALWSGSATNHVLTAIAAVPVFATIVLAAAVGRAWLALAVAISFGVLVATIGSHVRATVGPGGLRITMGWVGWPTRTVPLADIVDVRVEDVVPMRYGGWGFRLACGAQAHVIRGGPGIRVERRDRSAVVVTVNDAERGAAILAGYLRQLTGGGQSQAPESRS